MAGQGEGAAVEKIDDPGVAQDAQVPAHVVVIAAVGLGKGRCDAGHGGQQQRIERGQRLYEGCDGRGAQAQQRDVVGGADAGAQRQALAHARIVEREPIQALAVHHVGFGPRDAAAFEVARVCVQRRHRGGGDVCPGTRQRRQRG
ncbi:hypothetical protein D3C86_1530530 [compost metagenome]